MALTLHGYWRSTASWRVRIALGLKGLAFDTVAHDLRTGAHHGAQYRAINPQAFLPSLVLDDATVLRQSLAILEWLEETRPDPALLPAAPAARAAVRAAALVIAADTHPVQNLSVLKRVESLAGADEARAWAGWTIERGLAAFEALIADAPGPWSFGPAPGLADVVLVPQLGNAARFGVSLDPWPRIREIAAAAEAHPAFLAARPERQPDADRA